MVRCSKFGITPAWAGKSLFPAGNALCPWDHPRVGGEKSLILATRTALMGSPPRGRGKEASCIITACNHGITPAWAGKRAGQCWGLCSARDHPRVGGEKSLGSMPWQIWRGSPPRGRGKVAFWDFALSFSRITPAWAGKRRAGHPVCSSSRDHPRVGGEKPPR